MEYNQPMNMQGPMGMQGMGMQGPMGMQGMEQPMNGGQPPWETSDRMPPQGHNRNFLTGLLKFLKGGMFNKFGDRGFGGPERKMNVPQIENDMYEEQGGWQGGSSGTNVYDERIPNPSDYPGSSGGGMY